MNFLAPIFLWALPLISIPVIIHFLNRRNIRIVQFSTIRFLKKMEHESIRKLKILQILLLIIRTLMILAIVMMLARPVVDGLFGWVDDPDSTFSAIIMDNSLSNNGKSQIYSRSELNSAALISVLNTIADDAELAIVSLRDGMLYSGRKGDLPEKFNRFIPGSSGGNIMDPLQNIIRGLDRTYANRELFILSDGQISNFTLAPGDSLNLKDWQIYLIQPPELETNLAIRDVNLMTEIPVTNVPIDISVDVVNTGEADVSNALLQMLINDINVGQQLVSLEAGQSRTYIFRTAFHQIGSVRGMVELQGDQRSEDNRYYFHVKLPDQAKVKLVTADKDELLFIRNALNAINKDSLLINSEIFLPDQLSLLDLRSADLLIFTGQVNLDNSARRKVESFLSEGGHLVCFPANGDTELQNLNFLDLPSHAARIGLSGDAFQTLDEASLRDTDWYPVLFGETRTPIRFFQFFGIFDSRASMAYLENQQSIWNRYSVGPGLVDQFGFALNLEWTNFPIKGSFIPFWHLLLYSGSENERARKFTTEQPFDYQLSANELKNNQRLVQPDGSSMILTPDKDQTLRIESFQQTGFYQIQSGDRMLMELAVNQPADEVSAPIMSDTGLKNILNEDLLIIPPADDLSGIIGDARLGTELWYWFLLMLIFLMVIEMVLSNVYGTQKK